MASNERKEAGDLSRFSAFEKHPEKYHIFQALRLIEAQYADHPRLGRSRRPKQDAVRLKQRIDLAFSSSTVARFKAKDKKTGEPGEMAQYMFGLFGPNGPLPLHLTEYAFNRQRSFRDPTFKAFGDIFHHRMLSLLYRAYASGEPTSSFDRKGEVDPFAQKVAAFAGLKGAAFSERDAMPDLAKLRYAGRLAHGTRNEEGLLALISGFFGAPATMESFVGTWLELDKKDTWELGNPHKPAKLGQSCSIGSMVWTRQAKFRFRVGPVGLTEYKRLLPGGDSLKRLKSLVNNYMGEAMMWDMNLVLRKGEAEPAVLGRAAVRDEEVNVVVSHEEEVVTKVERAEEVPFSWASAKAEDEAATVVPFVTEPEANSDEAQPDLNMPEGTGAGPDIDAATLGDEDALAEPSNLVVAPDDSADILEEVAPPSDESAAALDPFAASLEAGKEPLEAEDRDSLTTANDGTASDDIEGGEADPLNALPEDMPPPPPPLDMDKTVVIPAMAPAAPIKVSAPIDFGEALSEIEETPQFPPLSDDKRLEDDTRPPPMGVYLGWTTWLGKPPDDKDLDQLFIQSDAQPGE